MESSGQNRLHVDAIQVAYDDCVILSELSLDLERGSLIGLIGPNGAGKTTLMLALSGQFRPRRGAIRFDGMDIYERNLAFKYRIGYVHEAPFFYPHLTAEEFLQFIARVKRVPSAELDLRVNRLLAQVCLNEERSKLTSELSQGMKKKLAIAAALIGAPDLLFLDEALNGVDVESAYQIKEGLREFTARGGTVLLSTHVLEVIEKLCDRYVVMKKGRIIDDVRAADWKETGRSSLEEYIIERLRRLD